MTKREIGPLRARLEETPDDGDRQGRDEREGARLQSMSSIRQRSTIILGRARGKTFWCIRVDPILISIKVKAGDTSIVARCEGLPFREDNVAGAGCLI
eukprot:CAMPEP_0195030036 /NCGR_PEP_ID=MMETSP0326_2-20130528/58042_1 /TAXON_ID=2866 ORGANISM="Crypthecodinium cohnii, Strain Seligo" /NCGR_SAMPLE_ID=MMETSP0326_2 /ASSEMBLY_ACC=CAM_ASM_000348 /LENGTH=97 /DNA_ID=CAMNT_0040053191 /DNA_START=55 /DNA_END=348 /DNA_ORIENTATION=+